MREGFRQLGSPGVQRAAQPAQHQGLEHHEGTAEGWQRAWQLRGALEQWGWEPTAEGNSFPAHIPPLVSLQLRELHSLLRSGAVQCYQKVPLHC